MKKIALAATMAFILSACTEFKCATYKDCDEERTTRLKCGEREYDVYEYQLCCNNTSLYSTKNQRCENGVVEAKCGSGWYVPTNTDFCVDGEVTATKGEFTDARDGKTYKYVTIGTQNWMADNLNYKMEGSSCYEDDPANCEKYGRLYYWDAALEACPSGWYLPDETEWQALVDAVGIPAIAGERLSTTSGWKYHNGTDEYGFSALPGGFNENGLYSTKYAKREYMGLGEAGYWWNNREYSLECSFLSYITNAETLAISGSTPNYYSWLSSVIPYYMQSIRCIQGVLPPKPAIVLPPPVDQSAFGTLTDSRDGKKYKTVKIGIQTWMAENLNYDTGSKNSRCYDNKEANCNKCGRLYTWEGAMGSWDGDRACPNGWHLPSSSEWDKLLHYADGKGGRESAYESLTAGEYLKAKEGWENFKGKSGNGTDRYGFAAQSCGYGDRKGDHSIGYFGYWFSSTGANGNFSEYYYMYYIGGGVSWGNRGDPEAYSSVRCVKN
ncbi:MAG: hypothetical protein FWF63_10490 [Fibromonadales bacterium]|nr:hypothetical protein [Fibromonadales bacterium]